MDVLSLQIFVSLILVLVSILLFLHAAKSKAHEHAERLALLPLEGDREAPPKTSGASGADRSSSPRGPR